MTYQNPSVAYDRQRDILDPDKAADVSINVLGCGTVGSWTAACLAKAGFKKFYLVDMDDVEDVNLPSQYFDVADIGSKKSERLARSISFLGDDMKIVHSEEALEGYEQYNNGVILSAVDDMEMRRLIFENGARGKHGSLFIDFRMGGNLLKVWAFDTSDQRRCDQYAATLHSQADAADLPCGGRTFSPVGPLAGSIATQLVTKWLRDGDHPPFHIQMDFDRFACRAIGLPSTEENA